MKKRQKQFLFLFFIFIVLILIASPKAREAVMGYLKAIKAKPVKPGKAYAPSVSQGVSLEREYEVTPAIDGIDYFNNWIYSTRSAYNLSSEIACKSWNNCCKVGECPPGFEPSFYAFNQSKEVPVAGVGITRRSSDGHWFTVKLRHGARPCYVREYDSNWNPVSKKRGVCGVGITYRPADGHFFITTFTRIKEYNSNFEKVNEWNSLAHLPAGRTFGIEYREEDGHFLVSSYTPVGREKMLEKPQHILEYDENFNFVNRTAVYYPKAAEFQGIAYNPSNDNVWIYDENGARLLKYSFK